MSSSTAFATRMISTAEAGRLLGVTPRTIQNWIDKDAIPYVRLPSTGERPTYRIPLGALLDSLAGTYDLADTLTALEERARKAGLTEATITELLDQRDDA